MDVELAKKHVGIAMRICHRYASRHPLLVFMVFVLIWMYRSFPLLFSLLIYASPVIASTSVLLGTLLYFGHKNAPEIRKERKQDHHEIFNFKTRVMGDTEIGERDVRNEVHERTFGKNTFVVNNDRPRVDIDKFGSSSLIDSSVSRAANKKVNQESNSVVGNGKRETDSGDERVVFVSRCAQFQPFEAKTNELKSGGKLGGHSNHSIDHCLEGVEKFQHRDEDIKGWETGSELAESSSPRSMAEIFPMLDEFHPLLESEVPHQHVHMSNVSTTDATSDDYDDEDQEDMEEEEEEVNANEKEDASVITWTEDDQKNLVNLGTSELERNERLEHLIARQKALKNMRILAEKNMATINSDLAYSSTHISTAKKNPFDLPYDSNAHIVGSAPSVTMPERNPFDRPHDPNGKKPDPTVSSVPLQQNDQLSHRHESFDVGPSALGPYFVPERIASEVTHYSSMHREMGEFSDSKVSSTPDTESIDSSRTQDDHSPEGDTFSIKEGSIASIRTEDYRAREADLNSIKGGYCTSEVSEHVSQHSRSSDDEDTLKLNQDLKRDDGLDEVKTSGVDETGYEGKSGSESSSSSFSDVTERIDDDEDEFRSAVMPLTPESKESQIQEHGKEASPNFNSTSTAEPAYSSVDDSGSNSYTMKHDDQTEQDDHSEIDNTEETGLPQRLSQMQQGLTSWFGWKA